MIVKCISNKASYLKNKELEAFKERVHLSEVGLEIGRSYPVFGIFFTKGIPWYLICEEEDDSYVHGHIASFFRVVDSSMPSNWSFSVDEVNIQDPMILPEEWSKNKSFNESILEGDFGAKEYFEGLKELYRLKS